MSIVDHAGSLDRGANNPAEGTAPMAAAAGLAAAALPESVPLRTGMYAFLLAAYGLMVILSAMSGLRVDYIAVSRLSLVVFTPLILGILYCEWRSMPGLKVTLEALFCGLALTVPIGLSTYLAIGANMPMADGALIAMDGALGFDWTHFIRLVDANPWLAVALQTAYSSFGIQLLAMPILLMIFGLQPRAYLFVINYGLICFVSSLVSIWFPALGTYSVYGMDPASLKNINAYYGFAFLDEFHAVRSDPGFIFSPVHMKGILTFPSVHAGVATLCAWAAWRLTLLRYPFLLLNVLMAVSAISHANHYLVDVLAGMSVAAGVIAATGSLGRSERRT